MVRKQIWNYSIRMQQIQMKTKSTRLAWALVFGFFVFEIYHHRYLFTNGSQDNKTSYSLGQDVAKNLLRQGIQIETQSFYKGVIDGLENKSHLTQEEHQTAQKWAKDQALKKQTELEQLRQTELKNEMEKQDQRNRQMGIYKNPLIYQRPIPKIPPPVKRK